MYIQKIVGLVVHVGMVLSELFSQRVSVSSSPLTEARSRSRQVFRKPLGSSGAAGSAVNRVCHEVEMPMKKNSCVTRVGNEGLW